MQQFSNARHLNWDETPEWQPTSSDSSSRMMGVSGLLICLGALLNYATLIFNPEYSSLLPPPEDPETWFRLPYAASTEGLFAVCCWFATSVALIAERSRLAIGLGIVAALVSLGTIIL